MNLREFKTIIQDLPDDTLLVIRYLPPVGDMEVEEVGTIIYSGTEVLLISE